MDDTKALQEKSLAELREIAKALGIKAQMRKQELLDTLIAQASQAASSATPTPESTPKPASESSSSEVQPSSADTPRRGRKPKHRTLQAETPEETREEIQPQAATEIVEHAETSAASAQAPQASISEESPAVLSREAQATPYTQRPRRGRPPKGTPVDLSMPSGTSQQTT
ncbi:MAG: Rho termination factor N-terminal domain-containing protein, partial [Alistipes sp.]|nr:Rho termination factor N-terminal domain-containing protein [Alistipes sp.]